MINLENITTAIKDTAKEMILSGISANEVAKTIANKFDNSIARLIMIDIALDLNMTTETKKYIAQL